LSWMSAAADIWQSACGLAPAARPAVADRRFAHPEWETPVFDTVRQGYMAAAKWVEEVVEAFGSSDPIEKRRQAFFSRQMVDALCPANFLGANPVAMKEALETRGESLVRGMQNFVADLERGDGQLAISQTDMTGFKVGENVATAPGKVVFQNELLQLLQFSPSTEQVHEIPVVMITPWINKYYIIDLQPANSMIRWLTQQGFTVFVTSWVNPDESYAETTFEDYMLDGVLTAVGAALKQTGASKVNAVGYCIGGTILACAMAYLAARGDPSAINSATFFAAQQDFSEAGDLTLFATDAFLKEIERQMDEAGGVLPGQAMAGAFNALRANDLIWSFFVNNYLMGKPPKPFDLLFWNSDQTRMPKTLHLWYLREFYQENKFSRGELVLNGARLDLSQVTTPIYMQASKEDHIAPFASVYRGARLFGGPVTFTLAGSGHIAGVINHPDAKKYQHWLNPALPEGSDDWFGAAEEHAGSWWPHWGAWLAERSGEMVAARDPAAGPLRALEDAPGSYVQVRS
ncbi:MAG: class poly(R)-hydroxyalkanoic acid synthase, partial [Phenylobacterium sp.]|nr:class poly(R)-hydroxyalkanoic acid synthase [Phenylobacterium sp.]